MKILIRILICVLFIFMCLCLIFYIGWTSSSDPREEAKTYKKIEIINNLEENVCLVINICYTNDEVDYYNKRKTTIDKGYSRIDTLCLKNEYPENHSHSIILPIKINEKIDFPNSFSIEIYNWNMSKLLKKIDSSSFVENIQIDSASKANPLLLNEWILIIDSTLLGKL